MGAIVNIDIGVVDTLRYAEEKIAKLFKKDAKSVEFKNWLMPIVKGGWEDAATVQVVGMHAPIPLSALYQPPLLHWNNPYFKPSSDAPVAKPYETLSLEYLPGSAKISVERLLSLATNAVFSAGPGWGKTTLLQYIFMRLAGNENTLPVLFMLRRTSAVADLVRFIDHVSEVRDSAGTPPRILLLVDGYDEIPSEARKKVSEALMRFTVKDAGHYYLTCREFYDVYDIKAPIVRIEAFSEKDQIRYVDTFSKLFDNKIEAQALIGDLRSRGLEDFLRHPLLLALTCIVKSGPLSDLSTNVLGLIQRAVDTLSFRWDQGKGIERESKLPLDGPDRIKILMRLAFSLPPQEVDETRVYRVANKQLELLRRENLDTARVLYETAQFFGIYVPTSSGWKFVHKTLRDYLGAKFWVEAEQFTAKKVQEWTPMAAYAACLTPDATESIKAVIASKNLATFAEMLQNDAPFDDDAVAAAVIAYYKSGDVKFFFERRPKDEAKLSAHLQEADVIRLGVKKFLVAIVRIALQDLSNAALALMASAIVELHRRNATLPRELYASASSRFGEEFVFKVNRNGAWIPIRLRQLKPAE